MAVTASFSPTTGVLTVSGDGLPNTITVSRNAAGTILVNGGAVAITGGTATVANTSEIDLFGFDSDDTIRLDESSGALPRAFQFGGLGNDVATGGSGNDQLSGEDGNDTLLGKGGSDLLLGGDGDDVLTGGDADDQVFGEAGNDRMIWNPGDDTDLFEGGDGSDTAEVNGGNAAEQFTITPNGTRVRFDRVTPAPFSLDLGTTEALVLNANGGDDIVTASNGLSTLIHLTIDGGTGNDTIGGGDGADLLLGGDGNDRISGGRGDDLALLGAGDDVFVWNPGDGNDTVEGQANADTLLFNGANIAEQIDISANGGRVRFTRDIANIVQDINDVETIDFHAVGGTDTVTIHDLTGTDIRQVKVDLGASGGGGDTQADQVVADGTAGADVVTVRFLGGVAVVQGLAARIDVSNIDGGLDLLTINGLDGNDTFNASGVPFGTIKIAIDAGAGNDTITGSQAADVVLGGIGNDRFIDNDFVSFDAYDGGDGIDTIDYSNVAFTPGAVTIDLATGQTVVSGGNTETIANFERVVGSGGGETIIGSNAANVLDGGAGDDTIDGGDGNDVLIGGLGADSLTGGLGIDRAQYLDAAAAVVADLQVAANNAGEAAGDTYNSVENLSGSTFGDDLRGDGGANTISGGTGNDMIAGRDGDDRLSGDDGNDVLTGGIGADALTGGLGTDRAQYIDATAGLVADLQVSANNAGAAAGDTYNSIENLSGSAFGDSLSGEAGANTISGGAGNDTLAGRDGDDTLNGDDGNDVLTGGIGADALAGGTGTDRVQYVDATAGVVADLQVATSNTGIAAGDTYSSIENLFGSNFNDSLRGDGAGNTIWGRNGNDLVSGRDGDDTLFGGAGNDTLVGGDGSDRYVFDSALSAATNVDRLSDFSVADDTVALDGAVFDALPAGALASAAFFIGSAAHDADDRLIYNATTGALFYDADGNGGAATAVQFATLGSGLALTNNDFVVV